MSLKFYSLFDNKGNQNRCVHSQKYDWEIPSNYRTSNISYYESQDSYEKCRGKEEKDKKKEKHSKAASFHLPSSSLRIQIFPNYVIWTSSRSSKKFLLPELFIFNSLQNIFHIFLRVSNQKRHIRCLIFILSLSHSWLRHSLISLLLKMFNCIYLFTKLSPCADLWSLFFLFAESVVIFKLVFTVHFDLKLCISFSKIWNHQYPCYLVSVFLHNLLF